MSPLDILDREREGIDHRHADDRLLAVQARLAGELGADVLAVDIEVEDHLLARRCRADHATGLADRADRLPVDPTTRRPGTARRRPDSPAPSLHQAPSPRSRG